MTSWQNTVNSSNLCPSLFPGPHIHHALPHIQHWICRHDHSSHLRDRESRGRNFCKYWKALIIEVVLFGIGVVRLGGIDKYDGIDILVDCNGWFCLKCETHQIHSSPSIQTVGCLHCPFPLCCLSRRTCNVSPCQWASYFGTYKYHHPILSPVQCRGQSSFLLKVLKPLHPSPWWCPASVNQIWAFSSAYIISRKGRILQPTLANLPNPRHYWPR